MNKHIECWKYILKHKYFVLVCGLKLKVPLWRLIIHDWSKFLPSEWIPYANYFYAEGGSDNHANSNGVHNPADGSYRFNVAWLKHQHRQPHHWQYWLLREDDGDLIPLPMPEVFVREMVADWCGAGAAQGHGNDISEWYVNNRDRIHIHPYTRALVDKFVEQMS
jgi:hypothetical protein